MNLKIEGHLAGVFGSVFEARASNQTPRELRRAHPLEVGDAVPKIFKFIVLLNSIIDLFAQAQPGH
ncbi:MAG: hypothetical protein HY390_01150 [Deltaproteobacteria bacterium]|nr:hypothetical protein [Deltaproteobacteria bacterium]